MNKKKKVSRKGQHDLWAIMGRWHKAWIKEWSPIKLSMNEKSEECNHKPAGWAEEMQLAMIFKRCLAQSTRMSLPPKQSSKQSLASFDDFIQHSNYSLLNTLNPDPESTKDGQDHRPRQVRSGHFVPVTPKPLAQPTYVSHSKTLFYELGLDQDFGCTSKPLLSYF